MEYYKLAEDEVVLYKGNVELSEKETKTQLILTNLKIVFITKNEETNAAEIFGVDEVKIYEGMPQVKTHINKAEIYFKSTEKEFKFESWNELHKFTSAINKLLTGKTAVQRGAAKVKDAIALVDDTLNINSVQVVGDILKNNVVNKATKGIGAIGKSLFNKDKK